MKIAFTDAFNAGSFSLYCNKETREDLFRLKINRVRVVRRADGYYAQFCFDADRKEQGEYTGNVVGWNWYRLIKVGKSYGVRL